MKFTFSTPNHEHSAACGLPPVFTVEADSEAEARERAMHERHGPPKFGLGRWTGQGLELQEPVAD
jgi:hypothetical protein